MAAGAALNALVSAVLGPDPQRTRDVGELTGLWRGTLHEKDAVVILDNAAGAEQVRPLLPGDGSCAVLVTSRRRFALPGAKRLDLRRMRDGDARALLRGLAPRLSEGEAGEIAKACGCLPLALRVAGNYLGLNDDCAVGDYLSRLGHERQRLRVLRDPDDPDLDVEAAIGLSVGQLEDKLREAWGLLVLFPAPFDQAGAGEVVYQFRWKCHQADLSFPRCLPPRSRGGAGIHATGNRHLRRVDARQNHAGMTGSLVEACQNHAGSHPSSFAHIGSVPTQTSTDLYAPPTAGLS